MSRIAIKRKMPKKIVCIVALMLTLVCVFISCDEKHRHSYDEKHKHSYGNWEVEKVATCTTSGVLTRTCECGEAETKTTTKKGHTTVVDEAIPATCSATGLTEGMHCSACNATLTKQTLIPTIPHTEVIDEAIAPTYTTTGLTEGKHCSVCNAVLLEQLNIATIWNGGEVEPTKIVNIDGTYYYEINSAEELAYVAMVDWSNCNFILNCDIWLNEDELRFDEEGNLLNDTASLNIWQRTIECQHFNGNNHTIKGVYSAPLISSCNSIQDLHLKNAYITAGGSYCGGICNSVKSIYRCSFDGVIYNPDVNFTSIKTCYIGGVAGFIEVTAVDCINYGLIVNHESGYGIGGIVGDVDWNFEPIKNCINYGNIISTASSSSCLGGIASRGAAINCINYGNVTGTNDVCGIGALRQQNCTNYGTVSGNNYVMGIGCEPSNCTNYGAVSGKEYVYGIGGRYDDDCATTCTNYGTVSGKKYVSGIGINATNCTNHGDITGEDFVGGICGKTGGEIKSCKNTGIINGTTNVGAIVGYLDIFSDDSYISNCYYLKTDTINTNLKGIGNLDDATGKCQAKDQTFFGKTS